MKLRRLLVAQFVLCFCVLENTLFAQTTEFKYQGSLRDAGIAANGNYDFEFALFDALAAGTQLGPTVSVSDVAVTNGIFTVNLNFGNQFTGADRYLEIRVRLAGQPGITTLDPRQLMNSAPYSVKSLNADNAAQLGGVAANQYVTTASGAANYIQNSTTQQASSNFNVSGNGIVGGTFSANGNVGIGTSTPQKKLHVVGQDIRIQESQAVIPRFSIFNTSAPGYGTGKWQNYATTSIQPPNESSGNLIFSSLDDSETVSIPWLDVQKDDGPGILSVSFPNGTVFISNTLRVGGFGAVRVDGPGIIGGRFYITPDGKVGIGLNYDQSPDKLAVNGSISFATLGAAGSTQLCRNAVNQISTCSSSLRYKTNIGEFLQGISFVRQLRPITFDWKDGGMKDVGFGAEDIAKIDPRFVTYNDKGEVEGVKYDRLSVAFVNAFKEQQQQIEAQEKKIESLEKQVVEFKRLVCSIKPDAEVCTEKPR